MSDIPYNKRELDHFLGDMKDQLNRIEEQTRKTNGRTTANEQAILSINTKINTTIWAFGITLPIILALGGIIFYAELKNIQSSIPNIVSQSLDGYNFSIIEE